MHSYHTETLLSSAINTVDAKCLIFSPPSWADIGIDMVFSLLAYDEDIQEISNRIAMSKRFALEVGENYLENYPEKAFKLFTVIQNLLEPSPKTTLEILKKTTNNVFFFNY